MRRFLVLGLVYFLAGFDSVKSQVSENAGLKHIEDNSYFLEEGYNQDPGVVQHYSSFQYMKNKTWEYNLTVELPLNGIKHQFSFIAPYLNNGNTGFGDKYLNYRYLVISTERLKFATRGSLILPVGKYKEGLGSSAFGYQFNLPLTYILFPWLSTHYNLGATFTPNAKDITGNKFNNTSYNYGASFIVLLKKTFHFMFETVGTTNISNAKNGESFTTKTLFINPGIRFAINHKSGLQIVPGISVPIGVGPSNGELGIFTYLSFEHVFLKSKK
ncbi:MAG: hypothetical protein IT232_09485 [Flavobacteriales bacterium]|nr:hypothetical protein [Flavobacteriales bacterium]